MPGISAIIRKSGSKPISTALCSLIRKEMLHFSFYESRDIIIEESVNFGFTGYKEYPIEVINRTNFNVVLEGRIYNQETFALEKSLVHIAEAQIHSKKTCDDELEHFLLNAEGEFVITIYDKLNRRIIVANDIMGRLPLYYFQDAESLIFSRELKFILPHLAHLTFCKEGILEYLLYGFPFEENTFVEQVSFFPAATYIAFDMGSGKSAKGVYNCLNIDACARTGSRRKMAADMCRKFMAVLSDRAAWVDKDKTIVSLSGGFDSRGTLAGMKKLGLHPTAVTAQSDEELSAREVAESLGTEVYAIPQGNLEGTLPFADIVFFKDGLDCHPNLAQLYQNLQNLRDRFGGDIVYFTGIYGGEITRHSHPTSGFPSMNSLVKYLLKANDSYKYSTEKVAAIMQVPQKEIRTLLKKCLAGFPEKRFCRKYTRFRHEYDVRFAGEAEDRNRYYFWTITPYFAFPFFKYVMSINENKKTSWLFRDFLFAIDPHACAAKYFNYSMTLNNPFTLRILAFLERLTRHVFVKTNLQRIRRLLKTCHSLIRHQSAEDTETMRFMKEELMGYLNNSGSVKAFFNNPDLPDLIEHEEDSQGLDRLRIVFAYIDRATRWHTMLGEKTTVPLN